MPIRDLDTLLAQLTPRRQAGDYAFATLPPGATVPAADLIASVLEAEGRSVVVPLAYAQRHGLDIAFRAAWITLDVHSDLAAVGLTAAVATALSAAGIACNVVAGTCHDHLFVPLTEAERALAVLTALGRQAPPAAGT